MKTSRKKMKMIIKKTLTLNINDNIMINKLVYRKRITDAFNGLIREHQRAVKPSMNTATMAF